MNNEKIILDLIQTTALLRSEIYYMKWVIVSVATIFVAGIVPLIVFTATAKGRAIKTINAIITRFEKKMEVTLSEFKINITEKQDEIFHAIDLTAERFITETDKIDSNLREGERKMIILSGKIEEQVRVCNLIQNQKAWNGQERRGIPSDGNGR